MTEERKKTMFRLVMPSAQKDVPVLERGIRLFLADGTEIVGARSVAVSVGETDSVTGLRGEVRVTLEFDRDQFTVEK